MSILHKKVFSRAPVKCFSVYGWNNSDSVVFGNAAFGEVKDHSLRTTSFQKKFGYGSFRYVFTIRKKVFSGEPVKCVFLYGSNNWDYFAFMGARFAEIKDQFENYTSFLRKFIYGSFGFLSTLHKKVFLGAPVKWFFFYGSNKSDSVVFKNAAFREIKDHSLRTTSFQKKPCYGSFGFVSTLYKKLFSIAPVKCFFPYNSNNWDSVVFWNAAFGEIKDRSLRMTIFQKKIAMDVLGLCLSYLKLFSRVPVKCFSLYGSNNSDSVVFGNVAFGEIKDQFENDNFSKKNCYGCFGFVSTLPKVIFQSTSEVLFSLRLK